MSNKSKKTARRRARKQAKSAERKKHNADMIKRFPQIAEEPENNIKLKGFRQGKVPPEIIDRMSTPAEDEDDELDDLPTSFVSGGQ